MDVNNCINNLKNTEVFYYVPSSVFYAFISSVSPKS